ncbi:MAG TPA: ABC transporter permease [Lentimicrobium sp.]|nr:ABC transporter permease [Lentimicrobium sp.]
MVSNYIQSAFRNFSRNKGYTLINILGLSLGITAAFFILLYINDELGYDRHYDDYRRIYRLEGDFSINNKHDRFAVSSVAMAPALKLEFPDVEMFCRFAPNDNLILRYNDKEFIERQNYFADSTAPVMFSLNFTEGNPDHALTDPFHLIMSERTARKYFGTEEAYGKTVVTGSGRNYKVSGVFRDLPDNSHLKFDILLSMGTLSNLVGEERFSSMEPGMFWNVGVYSYILLNEGSDVNFLLSKFPVVYEKYMREIGDQINGSFALMATRIDKVHHTSKLAGDLPVGNLIYVYVLGIIGIMILVLASINYMNLATARAAARAREVGLRKVVGANRGQLARQFISESLILAFISFFISLALIQLLLPVFNDVSGKQLSFSIIGSLALFSCMFVIALFIGILSGTYPALFLSSFQPAIVLKGRVHAGRKGSWMRKGLVTIQLIISVAMITGTLVIYSQIHFMRTASLGFDKENLLVLEVQDTAFLSRIESFRNDLLEYPGIVNAELSAGIPGGRNGIQVMRVEKEEKMQEYALNLIPCNYDYPELLGLEFIEGRSFSKDMGTDRLEAVIINETCAQSLGWGKDALGKKIHYNFELDGSGGRMMKVIGVVKDFNFTSLHNKVEPIILFIPEFPMNLLSVRIKPGFKTGTINFIRNKWETSGANRPFDYFFLDESYDELYTAEKRVGKVFMVFSVLSIFIALLGLVGLSSFTASQRSKEIGIRKVLGASVATVLRMLYKESLLLMAAAFVIATPVSWYFLDKWLDNFAYHINPGIATFLLAGIIALVVTLGSVSFHAIKAASANPVKSIKYE